MNIRTNAFLSKILGKLRRLAMPLGALLAVWLGLSTGPLTGLAHAEESDRDQPIELEADTVTVNDAKKISIYTGNVVLTQGTLVIKADKMIVREDQDGFQHSTSTGNPTTFKQKRTGKNEWMQGSAQRIEYNGRMDKVQLYTNAWVKRGEDIVNGDYISYDANAEYAEVIGGTKANPNGTANSRVKATIQPKNRTNETVIDNKPVQQGLKMNRTIQVRPTDQARPADTPAAR